MKLPDRLLSAISRRATELFLLTGLGRDEAERRAVREVAETERLKKLALPPEPKPARRPGVDARWVFDKLMSPLSPELAPQDEPRLAEDPSGPNVRRDARRDTPTPTYRADAATQPPATAVDPRPLIYATGGPRSAAVNINSEFPPRSVGDETTRNWRASLR